MSQLHDVLDNILSEKINNLRPEIIKEGNTILGVEGELVVPVTPEEYTTLLNLTNLILGETPIIEDLYITINNTINMSASDLIHAAGGTIYITTSEEEV